MDGEQNAVGFVYFSHQIPLECTCTAALWAKLIETSLFLRKTDVSLCILGAPGARNERQHLVSAVQNPPSGANFRRETIAILG